MLVSNRREVLESQPGIGLAPTRVPGRGGLAWNVWDEELKTRIDLPTEDALSFRWLADDEL